MRTEHLLSYLLPALLIPFARYFIIKGNTNKGRNLPSSSYASIAFINEEATDCINQEAIGAINEAAIGAIIAPRNPPTCLFISCCTVSVTQSFNRLDFSIDSTILINHPFLYLKSVERVLSLLL